MAIETAISAANVEARRRVRSRSNRDLLRDGVSDDIWSFNLGFFPMGPACAGRFRER